MCSLLDQRFAAIQSAMYPIPSGRLSTWQCSAPPSSAVKIFSVFFGVVSAAQSWCAASTGTTRSFAPCVISTGQVILCATPSSENSLARPSAVSESFKPRIHWNWKFDCALFFGSDLSCSLLFERRDARRVIAAEAVAHDHDFFRIDVRALRHELVGGRARRLVIVARVDSAKPQRLALPRPVDRERIHPAPRELEAREEHAHLLAVVHAVEEHHRRRAVLDVGLHEIRRQRLAFVGHLDELDVPVPALEPLLITAQSLPVDAELALARGNEALA